MMHGTREHILQMKGKKMKGKEVAKMAKKMKKKKKR